MKLLKFRVRNYKSIIDSGDCWMASDITTLAGKNESGKTAVLEALRDADPRVKEIPKNAYPLDDVNNKEMPSIELCFHLDSADVEVIFSAVQPLEKEISDYISSKGLTIKKLHDGKYLFSDKDFEMLYRASVVRSNKRILENIQKTISAIITIMQTSEITNPTLSEDIETAKAELNKFIKRINAIIIADAQLKTQIETAVNQISQDIDKLISASFYEKSVEIFVEILPSFIFFSDFQNILPFEVAIKDLKLNQPIEDFAKIANLDLDKVIAATDSQRRRNMLSTQSAQISGKFLNYWQQNEIEIKAEPEGEKLRFGVVRRGETIDLIPKN